MTMSVKTEIDRIVNTFAETGLVTKIFLFGSRARGEDAPNSLI